MGKICLIEDSDEVAIIVRRTFEVSHSVRWFKTLGEAQAALQSEACDLILLDICLPDGDGLRFCSEIKSMNHLKDIPIFILSAKTSIQEKTLGFQLGIDDFIEKPFNAMELRLRVDAKIKKFQENQAIASILSYGELRLNIASQRVQLNRDGELLNISLSSKEFGILTYLLQNIDQVKSREQIISAIWGESVHITDRSIDSHISRIRKKISASNIQIEAIANAGYRLCLVLSPDEKSA